MIKLMLGGLAIAVAGTGPALAQESDRAATAEARPKGPYAVARAGVAFDSDFRFRGRDVAAPATVRRDTDFRSGFNGEIGGGYDFGGFRLEGTVGYANAKLDRHQAGPGFTADGRVKALTLGVSGYVDIPTGSVVTPFVGGGIGASRVDARYSRLTATLPAGTRFYDKDWGFQWHVDAGLGVRAGPNTTVELSARYARTSALAFQGLNGPVGAGAAAGEFRPRLSSVSGLIGIRQRF